ncbi:hypothetical protein APR12_002845 [Nocardia amikacinitolerans]|uniref:YcxB family protein n=1 Tax=Nocardia amikacinitolerans TaxID=756689 RepID=UPI000A8FE949|nr:YcxB family protein [Nocardia amikacinitolerans]MCP2317499.1 hypothetical protein [Nocardia amikacinitolerans]
MISTHHPDATPTGSPCLVAADHVADVTTAQRLGRANTLTVWRTKLWIVLVSGLSIGTYIIGRYAETSWSDPGTYPIGWFGVLLACTVPNLIVAACTLGLRTTIPSPMEKRYSFPGAYLVAHYHGEFLELWTPIEHSTVPYARIKKVIVFSDAIVLYFGLGMRYAMPRQLVPAPALTILLVATKRD